MNPQPIRPMFSEVTRPCVCDDFGNLPRVLGEALEYVVERRRHKFAKRGPPVFSLCARRYMAAQEALLKGHQYRVDDVPCHRRGGILRKLALVFVSAQDRGQGIFPEAEQPAVLLQRRLITAQTFHDDQS